jgi:hypothetical protein
VHFLSSLTTQTASLPEITVTLICRSLVTIRYTRFDSGRFRIGQAHRLRTPELPTRPVGSPPAPPFEARQYGGEIHSPATFVLDKAAVQIGGQMTHRRVGGGGGLLAEVQVSYSPSLGQFPR